MSDLEAPIPEQVFLDASRALNTMWGYHLTLNKAQFERLVRSSAQAPHLRKTVTVAYRAGQAATMVPCSIPGTPGSTHAGPAAAETAPASSEMQAQLALRVGRDGQPSRSPRRLPTQNSSNANGRSIA